MVLVLYAILIFVVFATVGGLAVWFVVRNQSDQDASAVRQRGIPTFQDDA